MRKMMELPKVPKALLDFARFVLLVLAGDVHPHPGPPRRGRPPLVRQRPPLPTERSRAVRTETRILRAALLAAFEAWLLLKFRLSSVDEKIEDVKAMNFLLDKYGEFLYYGDRSIHDFRETINAVVARNVMLKRQLPVPWSLVTVWEGVEPSIPHEPLPVPVFRAMVSLCVAWGWPHVLVALWAGFGAALRPIEIHGMTWGSVITPRDRLEHGSTITYFRVADPTTRWLAARKQFGRLEDEVFGTFFDALRGSLRDRSQRVLPGSPSWFKSRFDDLARFLGLIVGEAVDPASQGRHRIKGLVPASLRTGGATYKFLLYDRSVSKTSWDLRVDSTKVLEHYLQETQASMMLASLPEPTRNRIELLASVTEGLVHQALPLVHAGVPPRLWRRMIVSE